MHLTEDQILAAIGIATLGGVAIIAVNAISRRAGVAAPLLLVALGVAVAFLPFVPAVEVEPEWILAGVLPPLLYSSAVSMPTMDFRRDFTAIGGLSVVLVVVSAVLLGFMFSALIPGLPLSVGIALGAIVSPTDAAATAIVRRLGVSPRVVTVLEGESLLNDASALVLLRSAVAASAMSVSLWSVAGDFVLAVVIAVAVGFVVGLLGLFARARVGRPSLSTAVSFVVPFVAYLPAERLGASGLVAVVTAGLVTGNGAAKYLKPQDRISERSNWTTVETLLEGGVFLLMGLELFDLVADVGESENTVWQSVWVAALALVAVLVIRSAYVLPLVQRARKRARRGEEVRGYIAGVQSKLDAKYAPDGSPLHPGVRAGAGTGVTAQFQAVAGPQVSAAISPATRRRIRKGASALPESAKRRLRSGGPDADPQARVGRIRSALRRRAADIDYLTAEPLGPREGVLLVWAGMRGVVTVAAAQTLPLETPHRSLLVLVAFVVAALSLLVQGGTLPFVVRWLGLTSGSSRTDEDRAGLRAEMDDAAAQVVDATDLVRPDGGSYDPVVVARVRHDVLLDLESHDADDATPSELFGQYRELRLRAIDGRRRRLLAARSDGVYSSQALSYALNLLDAEQIDIEMRRGPAEETEET